VALPNLLTHKKFGRLVRLLASEHSGGRIEAMGILECLWSHCYQNASPEIGTADDMAYILDYRGDAAALAAKLVSCGFLDEVMPGHYCVHDLWSNCPRYVRRRRSRLDKRASQLCAVSGSLLTPDEPSLPDQTRPDLKTKEQQPSAAISSCANVEISDQTDQPNYRLLAVLGFDLVNRQSFESTAALREAMKTEAGRQQVPYDGPSISRAEGIVTHAIRGRGH